MNKFQSKCYNNINDICYRVYYIRIILLREVLNYKY